MSSRAKLIALMITAISLAARPDVMASAQCPNLSGRYVKQGEDGQVLITIDQQECDRITIVRRNNYLGTITSERHVLKLDGKDQKDSPWLGGSEQYRTSAKFVGSELQVTTRLTRGSTFTMIYALTAAGDLLEESANDRRGVPAKRQR